MRPTSTATAFLSCVSLFAFVLAGCGGGEKPEAGADNAGQAAPVVDAGHADHADHADHAGEAGHEHDEEVSIGSATIGSITVELAQGHGAVAAGKEGHLVVKLPYNDKGATVVRVWIGSSDRTLSYVGKGEYAPSHDDYDAHAIAPDPLPADAMWWVEIEKPDGVKAVGSAKPITG